MKQNDTRGKKKAKDHFILKMMAKLFIDFLIPSFMYYMLRGVGLGQLPALIIAAVPPLLFFLYRYLRGHDTDYFEVFVLLVIGASAVMGLIIGSPRMMLYADGFLSLALGCAVYASMRTKRPLMFHLNRSLYHGTKYRYIVNTAAWDEIWEEKPRFRRPWVVLTKWYSVECFFTGTMRLLMAIYLPVDIVPMLSGVGQLSTTVLYFVAQTIYLKVYGVWELTDASLLAAKTKEEAAQEGQAVVEQATVEQTAETHPGEGTAVREAA